MPKIELYKLEKGLKNLLSAFIIVLTIGVTTGLFFVSKTTSLNPQGAIERFNGILAEDEFEIPETYPKSIYDLLMTTHNHVISFALIFLTITLIFYFNTYINGFWKVFLTVEPFVSIILTFGSIWGIRFINENFVYLTIISSIIMYSSFYVMALVTLYEFKI